MAYYVQLEASYWRHPKTLKLIELLGRFADIYPPRLWSWAAQYRTTGVLTSAKELALACEYRGDANKLLEAMRGAGFIDKDELTIHDWAQKTGHGILMYEKEKERKRAVAERRRAEKSQESSALRSEEVAGVTGPDLTGPDLTGPERNNPPPPPAGGNLRASRRSRRKKSVDEVLSEAVQEGNANDREKTS
jgi:hypothetical protein